MRDCRTWRHYAISPTRIEVGEIEIEAGLCLVSSVGGIQSLFFSVIHRLNFCRAKRAVVDADVVDISGEEPCRGKIRGIPNIKPIRRTREGSIYERAGDG